MRQDECEILASARHMTFISGARQLPRIATATPTWRGALHSTGHWRKVNVRRRRGGAMSLMTADIHAAASRAAASTSQRRRPAIGASRRLLDALSPFAPFLTLFMPSLVYDVKVPRISSSPPAFAASYMPVDYARRRRPGDDAGYLSMMRSALIMRERAPGPSCRRPLPTTALRQQPGACLSAPMIYRPGPDFAFFASRVSQGTHYYAMLMGTMIRWQRRYAAL